YCGGALNQSPPHPIVFSFGHIFKVGGALRRIGASEKTICSMPRCRKNTKTGSALLGLTLETANVKISQIIVWRRSQGCASASAPSLAKVSAPARLGASTYTIMFFFLKIIVHLSSSVLTWYASSPNPVILVVVCGALIIVAENCITLDASSAEG